MEMVFGGLAGAGCLEGFLEASCLEGFYRGGLFGWVSGRPFGVFLAVRGWEEGEHVLEEFDCFFSSGHSLFFSCQVSRVHCRIQNVSVQFAGVLGVGCHGR